MTRDKEPLSQRPMDRMREMRKQVFNGVAAEPEVHETTVEIRPLPGGKGLLKSVITGETVVRIEKRRL